MAVALKELGWSVWWDRQILTGQAFDEVIERELAAAKSVVVLWSRHSVQSEWVKNEATAAAKRNILVPAMIEDVQLPMGFLLRQTANLNGWDGTTSHSGFQELCQGIAATIAGPLPPDEKTDRIQARIGLRVRIFAVIAALALVAGLALYWRTFKRTGHGDASERRITVAFHDLHTNDCPYFPPETRIEIKQFGSTIYSGQLQGCVGELSVSGDRRAGVSLFLKNAGSYELSSDAIFSLGVARWEAFVKTANPARVRVSLFKYTKGQCQSDSDFDSFHAILSAKVQSLREKFPAESRFDYLANLKVITDDTAQTPQSLNEFLIYWKETNSLQLLTGMCFVKGGKEWMHSRVYVGPVETGSAESFIELESPCDVTQFSAQQDVHLASMLLTLARDAATRAQDSALAAQYVSKALEYIAREKGPSAQRLRDNIEAVRAQFRIPDKMVF